MQRAECGERIGRRKGSSSPIAANIIVTMIRVDEL